REASQGTAGLLAPELKNGFDESKEPVHVVHLHGRVLTYVEDDERGIDLRHWNEGRGRDGHHSARDREYLDSHSGEARPSSCRPALGDFFLDHERQASW